MTKAEALRIAIRIAGGPSAAAAKLGISRQALWKMTRRGEAPIERVNDFERIAGGRVTREELRPDVFGGRPVLADHQSTDLERVP